MNKVKLKYDPNLSIKENAVRCGVSESAVRKYIRVNHIDRLFDSKMAKIRHINKLKRENPNITLAELSRATGYSINTIKKYLTSEDSPSEIATCKVSTFDVKRNVNNIKSFSFSQDEILSDILHLYVHAETYECDLTYSIGVFYRHLPQPSLKFDKYPQSNDVLEIHKS